MNWTLIYLSATVNRTLPRGRPCAILLNSIPTSNYGKFIQHTLRKKMLKWCGLFTYTEILAFSTLTWGGVFLSYLMWLLSCSIVCGLSSSNNRHLTDKVDFPPHFKCHQNLNNEVIYKVENAHWNKTIAPMWNIQRMPFKVAGPHYYNDFFGRVH